MLLSDTRLRNAKPAPKLYRLSDGDGLSLEVRPNGARLWRFRYRYAGRAQMLSLGKYPDVTLARARELRTQCRAWLADGHDPAAMRREQKARRTGPRTFEDVGREWFEKFAPTWAANTIRARRLRLDKHVYPALGRMPIDQVEPPDVLAILRQIEAAGSLDLCTRVRQYIGQIMRYGVACGYCTRDAAADLRGAIPAPVHVHHASVTSPQDVALLLQRIQAATGAVSTVYALRIAPYVFLRPTELRAARWDEIHWNAAEWRIPAERMKQRRPHVIPLATQVQNLLAALHPLTNWSPFLFPGRAMHKPLSDNALRRAIHRLGYQPGQMTPHGLRSMASTILNEHGWNRDVIERQLAHVEGDSVRAAYNYAQYLPERRRMMQWYADHLDALRDG